MLKTCPPDLTILLEIYIYWTYSDYKRMDRPYSIYFIQNVDHWTSCLAVLLTIYFLPATLLNLARSILRQNMRSLSYYWMLWTAPVTISTLSTWGTRCCCPPEGTSAWGNARDRPSCHCPGCSLSPDLRSSSPDCGRRVWTSLQNNSSSSINWSYISLYRVCHLVSGQTRLVWRFDRRWDGCKIEHWEVSTPATSSRD